MKSVMRLSRPYSNWGALLLAVAATVLVYWVGLHGPFLFDDGPNFAAIEPWLEGKASTTHILFGNSNFLTHRSLAMGSFLLGAKLFGYTPFSFKATNLALHLTLGLLAYVLLSRLLARGKDTAPHARLISLSVVAVWLLHPYNISTVLYAVQRMTQIAALFCLLGMLLYTWVRTRQESTYSAWRWPALFVGIPLLTYAGIQAKQSAIVLPALCLVIEIAYFSSRRNWPRALKCFYIVFLVAPALLLTFGAFLRPELLLDGFAEYPFTLYERLISEGRALINYMRMTILPHTPSMGVYTDDFRASEGLLSPPTTLLSLLLLASISAVTWRKRIRAPTLFAGWFLFLSGHSVEASILPIELYYEHRNYLPSIGLLLATASLIAHAAEAAKANGLRVARVGIAVGIAVIATLALMTHGRARVWSNRFVLAESELAHHPESVRAVINYAGLAEQAGDSARAIEVLHHSLLTAADGRVAGLSGVFLVRIRCNEGGAVPAGSLEHAFSKFPKRVDLSMTQILGYTQYLGEREDRCIGVARKDYADALVRLLDGAANQSDSAYPKWMLRHTAAKLYFSLGNWEMAREQAEQAWQPNAPPVVAEPLILALIKTGREAEAEGIYAQAMARLDSRVAADAKGMEALRQTMRDLLEAPPATPIERVSVSSNRLTQ